MSITSAIIISGDLIIESGQTSAGLLVEGLGYVIIENGGVLEDSIATSQGMITVDPGGLLQRTDVEEDGFLVIDGTAEEITARDSGSFQVYTGGALKAATLEAGGNGVVGAGATATDTEVAGGYFMLYGGAGENTIVSSGGSFVVQLDTGKAVKTTVLNGGRMRLISAGSAETTTVSGGFFEVLGGAASGTVLFGGSMRVNEGDTVQDTTLNDGKMEILAATAITTVVNGGEVTALSASTLQGITMNGGLLNAEGGMITSAIVDSGAFVSISDAKVQTLTVNDDVSMIYANACEMSGIAVKGGTGTFVGVSMNGFEVDSTAQVEFDDASVLTGKAAFADGAAVTLAGTTVSFDTEIATATEAQIQGLSAVTGDAVYTLAAGVDVGIYLLATGADEFNSDVVFGQYTLRLNEEPLKIGDLVYSINLTAGVLDLTIEEYVPPTPGIVTLAYANSEWANLADGTEVKIGSTMATIGTNAFATGDAATAAVAEVEDGKVRVAGGTVNFASGVTKNTTVYNGAEITNSDVAAGVTLIVNNGARLTGKAAFAAGAVITVNGTLVFDTQYATAEDAQFTGFSAVSGIAKYTLNAAAMAGIYLLATDAAAFTSDVTFGDVTLKVGEEAVTVDDFAYSLDITDKGELALTVISVVPPELAYVNSVWSDKQAGETVQISETVSATIGYDAFAALAPAIAAVTEEGAVEITGGEISFADGYSKTITVDADATIVGKADFDKPITVNGTFAFDIVNATAEKAQFGGFSFITGSTTTAYTLTVATPVIGSYLLASDAADFTGSITFGDVVLTVGEEAVKVGDFTYAVSLTEGNLALTIAEYIPPTPTLAYVNSAWSDKKAGDTVQISDTVSATIGYDAFATLAPAIAAVTEDGAVEITGGEISFVEGYSKTITVDAGATIVGKAVFDKAITVNGTFAFDIANATAEAAQFGGFSFVTGSTTTAYTLTAATPAIGTYLLATDAAAFTGMIKFGDIPLTVGAEAVPVGDFTYAITLTEGTLALTIAEYVPPVIVPTLAYVNSAWSGKKAGDIVTVGSTSATIGYDAFATLAPAIAAVTDDGSVEIVGGSISFVDGYSKTITVDAGATVFGKAIFDKPITVNGTFAFDIANATAEAAQFGGFSFVTGSTTTAYTLTAATPAAGTYLLAADAAAFNATVKFGPTALTVGAEAAVIGDFTYALTLTEGVLALTIAEYVPPTPTQDLVYVNSAWSDKKAGDTVQISDTVSATIGEDAFASGDIALANVTAEGTVEVVGGEVFFTKAIEKAVTIDAGATLVGKAAFTKAVTINGTVAFDTQYATADAAQFTGFSFVTGSTSTAYTLTVAAPASGTYLLASGAADFASTVTFDDVTLTVGAEAVTVGDFTYALTLTEGVLALTIAPPTPALAYVNSGWSDKQAGDTVQISDTVFATIGYDAFATLIPAITAVTEDGAVEIVGGEISFVEGYSKTITVDAGATVVGKAVFDKPITVNGTFAFDIANATAEAAQFGGFSFVTGSTTTAYTLTAANPAIGTYLLASDAAEFTGSVVFGDVTLTVGAEAAVVGDFTYALTLTEGVLALTIDLPTPTLAYVNSEWSDKQAGDTVQISETVSATIGYDAFAALAPAIEAVTEDGAVEIVGGEISFADGYSKTITVDAGATVVGKAVFDKAITINGTIAFDIANATAEEAQFGGFSFITGSTTTAYTLTAETPALGIYLLASDAVDFASTVTFGDVTLTVGAEAVDVGDFGYALTLTDGVLALTIVPPTPTLAYVNSEWVDLEDGTTVQISETVSAVIGYDAFAALAPAIEAVTDDGAVEVVGGLISFADGYSKTITVDADATVFGKAVFDKAITINGTIAFDIANATAEEAQFGGFSFITGSTTTAYTLTAAEPAIGDYLLATDAADFTGSVAFNDITLTVGAEAAVVGDFTYALSLNEGSLVLTIEEYIPPTPTLAYVNSEWDGLADKTVVTVGEKTAVIGYDAFAALAPAIAAVTDDGAVEIVGGKVSFAQGYSKTITVDADATVVGKATFKTPITVNGTIAFDTQYMTSVYAQFSTFSNISGTPTYTLTDSVKAAGTYQLASGAKGFKGNIKFSVYTLKVGGAPIRVGNFTYAVALMGGSLSLTVEKAKTPSPRPKLVYVNSEWANLASGTMVKINSTTFATLGKDAFADGDTAACTVDPKSGEIQIVGGSAFFTEDASSIIVSSGAALNLDAIVNLSGVTILNGGTMTAGSGAVVNALSFEGGSASATVVKDGLVVNADVSNGAHITVARGGNAKNIDLSGGDTAEEYGCLIVNDGGSAWGVTVSDGGSLTTENGSFLTGLTVFGGQTNIGGAANKATLYDAVNVTGWGEVSKAKVADGGSISTSNAEDGVGSVLDSEIQSGGIIHNAGFVSEIQVKDGGILETFDKGIAESADVQSGGLFIVSGSAAEACNLSLVKGGTVTVTDGAKLSGRITTENGAFIEMSDGTILEFDLSVLARPVDYALVSDFSSIDGAPDLVLTVSDAQEGGTYLLAGGADGFDRGIRLSEYTLTLESEPVKIGASTFSLNLSDDGVLSLFIDVPVFYVNSEWAGLEDGTIVTVDGVDAVIGEDAFATGDDAAAASPASAEIKVVGGTVSFADGIQKKTIIQNGVELTNTDVFATLILEKGAVLSGNAAFGEKAAVITTDGTIVFDSQYLEEGQPQFAGLSKVEGSPVYVLAPETPVGTYLFASDAADMLYQGIQIADGVTAYVGRAEFPVLKNAEGKQLSYVFDVTQNNALSLSVVEVKNELDNGWNNFVYDKKTKVLNPQLDSFVSTVLEDGVKGVLLDQKGTVYSDGRRNYVGGIKGGVTDEYDYAKITLEKGARLSFNLESTGAGKFTIWQLVEGTDKKGNVTYTMKSVQATTLKKDKTTGRYVATSKDLLIEAGDYYISMQATEAASKTGSYAFYNTELNYADNRTYFFVDDDNGWNNYVYDKKTNELNPVVVDGDFIANIVGKAGEAVQFDSSAAEFPIEDKKLTNFVGFGDDADYAQLLLPYDSSLVFNVTATDAAKFTIWQLVESVDKKGNVSYKMKEIQTTALKKDKVSELYTAETKELRLNPDLSGNYYVSVQSTNAKKGGTAYYSVVTSDKSIFYTDADNGWNDYVYDKKREEPLNKVLYESTGTYIYKKMGDIQVDTAGTVSEQIGSTTFKNFVGYGDDADYLKITLGKASTLSFNVTATNASKFVIYQLVEGVDKKGNKTYKMKEIQTSTLKKTDKYAEYYTVSGGTKATKVLEAGDYYIAVVATNAKKGELVYYNVALNDVGCSSLPNQAPQQENFSPAADESDSGKLGNTVSAGDPDELTGFDGTEEDNLEFIQTSSAISSDFVSAAALTDVQETKSAWQAMLA